MRGRFSRRERTHSLSAAPVIYDFTEIDLKSYESACRDYLDLRNFDSMLKDRTARAVLSVSIDSDKKSVSLESLGRSIECLRDMNEEGVKFLLKNKEGIWKNKELSSFVNDYFESSLETLSFCTKLDACLASADRIASILNIAIRKFDEEHHGAGEMRAYSRTLEELRKFQVAGDPFTQEFFALFDSARSRQWIMWKRLQAKKQKLDRKLGKLKAWHRVSNAIFVMSFASVLVFSVIAAAVSAPPVVIALAAAATTALPPLGKWMNLIWKECEKTVSWPKQIVGSLESNTSFVIHELNNIGACVRRFEIQMEALAASTHLAMKEDVAMVIAMEEMEKQVNGFFKTIQELREHANKCTKSTTEGRAVILRLIISSSAG